MSLKQGSKKSLRLQCKTSVIKRLNKEVFSLEKENAVKDRKIAHLHTLIAQWKTLFELSCSCRDKLIQFLQAELAKRDERITHLENLTKRYHEDMVLVQRRQNQLANEKRSLEAQIEEQEELLDFYENNSNNYNDDCCDDDIYEDDVNDKLHDEDDYEDIV